MPNIAGNSLGTATILNPTATIQNFSQEIVTPDALDYYRFSLSNRSSFNLSLTELSGDVNVTLLDAAGNPLSLGGQAIASNNSGLLAESINVVLEVGTYYIRVTPGAAVPSAEYTLNYSAASRVATDIIWRNFQDGSNGVWIMNGTAYSTFAALPTFQAQGWAVRGSGDFNRDGQTDILWRNDELGATGLWLMNGTAFVSAVALPVFGANGWVIGGAGDFNGDGSPDILWRNPQSGQNALWLMNGTQYSSAVALPAFEAPSWQIGGVGDFNSDGRVDILWRSQGDATTPGDGSNAVWLMNGLAYSTAIALPQFLSTSWSIKGTGDFNEDGQTDILWRDAQSGSNALWLMNGTAFSTAVALPPVPSQLLQPFAPFNRSGVPVPIDVAGDTLDTAFELATNATGQGIYRDRVGSPDLNDYYQFNLGTASRVSLALSQLSDNLDLALLDGTGTILQSSTLGALAAESIISTLTAGTYYVRVYPGTLTANGTYALNVSVNNLPVLVTNSPLSVNEGASTTLSSTTLQVTDNDNSPTQLTYTLNAAPSQGQLSLGSTALGLGSTFTQADVNSDLIRYTHNGSETTSDSFSFTLSDGAGGTINLTTVSIAVAPVNDPPALATNLQLTIEEGADGLISGNLLRITDPDNSPTQLAYSITSAPTNGTLLLSGTATTSFTQADVNNGLLRYQHNGSESITDSFTFAISDGVITSPIGGNTFAISVLPVNDPPTLSLNQGLTVSEGNFSVITNTVLQATDVDGPGPITYTLSTTPTNGVLRRGTTTLSAGQTFTQSDITTGQLSYLHNGSETLNDSFSFSLSDGLGAIAPLSTFSITVAPVNDAPVLTLPGNQTADQGFNTTIRGISVTDADVEAGELTVTLATSNGTLSLGFLNNLTFVNGDGSQDATMTFRGSLAAVNRAISALIYRSTNSFTGNATISLSVNDNGNTGGGGPLTANGTLTVAVAPVNDPPIITLPGNLTTREDTSLSINGISLADQDAANSELTVSLFVANGVISLASTAGLTFSTGDGVQDKTLVFRGSLSALNTALANLTYLGDLDYSGSDTLTVSVSDNGNAGNGVPLSDTQVLAITVTPVNDAPQLTVPPAQTTLENTDLRLTGIRITDPDAGTGDVTVVLSAVSGLLTLGSLAGLTFVAGDGTQDSNLTFRGNLAAVNNALNNLIYRGNPNFNGSDTIDVSVSDNGNTGAGIPLGSTASIPITVLGVNNAPVITLPPPPQVNSNTDLAITGISVADADAGGGILSVTVIAQNGVLALGDTAGVTFVQGTENDRNRLTFVGTLAAINSALSSLNYRSNPNFTSAFDRIVISVNDNGNTGVGVALSDTQTLAINVGGAVNAPPTAANDTFSTTRNTPLTIGGFGVLANDSDADGDGLAAILVTPPTNGSLNLNGNGSFTYTPQTNFIGTDTFVYRASDGIDPSNLATVTLSVRVVNTPPLANADSYSTNANSPLTVASGAGVLVNDTDANGDPLTAVLGTGPANGTLALNPSGSFVYTPNAGFTGTDRFTYRANDGTADSNLATVVITVNALNTAPVVNADAYSTPFNTSLSVAAIAGVLANDTDAEGDILSASVVAAPGNGSLSLNSNGSFVYTPTPGFTGTDTFTYQASDGLASSGIATVSVSVRPPNQAPVAAADSFSLSEDTSLSGQSVLTNDTDPDGNLPLTATLVAGVANGTLSLGSNGTVNYVPNANFNGSDQFTYVVRDSLGAISNTATVSLSIAPVNDAPVAVNDSFSVAGNSLAIAAPGVLSNDTDLDGDPLSAVLVDSPTNGTVSLSSNGSFTYTPNVGFSGVDRFTYRATDGTVNSANLATVTLNVNANAVPIAANDSFSLNEDTSLSGQNVLTNDTDPDGNLPLSATLVAGVTNGNLTLNGDGTFNYVPNANFNGSDQFTYAVRDSLGGLSNTATVSLTVNPVNDAPVAVNDSFNVTPNSALSIAAPGVLSNDTDLDGGTLSAVLVTNATSGTVSLNSNGSFTYTPNVGFTGSDSFTYRANDGSVDSANLATVSLSVIANTPPTAANDSFSLSEDGTLSGQSVLTNDTDPDGNLPLSAVLVAGVANGTLSLNGNGTFSYVPNANFNGSDRFTYVVQDSLGASSNTATVSLAIAPVNDAPVANPDTYLVSADGTLSVPAAQGVLSNDTDVDGNPLVANLVSAPASGTVTLNTDGSFIYRPTVGFRGTDTFTYQASDGALNSSVAVVSIAVNSPPIANNDTFSTQPNTPLTVAAGSGVLANDSDLEGSPLTANVVNNPSNGSLTFSANGSFVYVPNAGFTGADTFTYQASDGLANSGLATASITVSAGVNTPPTAVSDSYTAIANQPLSIDVLRGVLSNDSDAQGDTITATQVTGPTSGQLTLSTNGSFVYTPNAGFTGTDTFTYQAGDGLATSNLATVTLSVTTNTPPVANPDSYRAITNTPLSVDVLQGVLTNDTDAQNTPLSATVVSGPTSGQLTLSANGSFVYTPNAGFSGTDTFTYRASDGLADSAPATVNISVGANNPPVAVPDSFVAPAGQTLSIDNLRGVLSNDTDPEGSVLTASLVTPPTSGALTLNSNGSFSYVPNGGFTGSDRFVYQASDGVAPSAPTTVSLSVVANAPPVAGNDAFSVNANRSLSVAAPGIFSNDTDPDGDALTAVLQTPTSNGVLNFNPATGSFVYTPNAGFAGTDRFTYQLQDAFFTSAPATVTINVTPNTAPTAVADRYTVNQNNVLSVTVTNGVLRNDTDAEGDPLTAALASNPSNGTVSFSTNGSFVYTPNAGFSGIDTFTYRASDGNQSSAPVSVTLSVTGVSSPPTAVNDTGYTINANGLLSVGTTAGVLVNDTDPEGDVLRAIQGQGPSNGSLTLNSNGSFFYTPNANFIGTDTFTYQASDGVNNSNFATVTIGVGGPNSAPTITVPGSQAVPQGSTLVIRSGLTVNDIDAGANPVQATLSASNGTLTLSTTNGLTVTGNGTGNISITGAIANINAALTDLVYTPNNPDFVGTDAIAILINDQGNTGSGGARSGNGTVSVNVTSTPLLVADINPNPSGTIGTASSTPSNLVSVGNSLYFTANDGFEGTELWRSDGTANGTTRVSDIYTGTPSSSPSNLTLVGNNLFFSADNGVNGRELWKVDTTTGVASLVKDIRPLAGGSVPTNLVNFNGTLFFRANDGSGAGLWKSDGTEAGTIPVGSGFTQPGSLTVVGPTLYFTAGNGAQLWRSDGTNTGTTLIRDLGASAEASNLIAVGNTLFFTANSANGIELWRSDGTAGGTAQALDINVGPNSSNPNNLVQLGNTLYFFATDGTNFGLWRSTAAGAVSLVQALPSAGLPPASLTVVGSTLFFVVDAGAAGTPNQQLWQSNGTTASLVTDINPTGNASPTSLTNVGGSLFFAADDGDGPQLWRSDGTQDGTFPTSIDYVGSPFNLTPVGSRLFFAANNGVNGVELWVL